MWKVRGEDLRWRCPTRWIRESAPPEQLPALLWGQEAAVNGLELLLARARPDRPRHLLLSTPDQPGYIEAIGAFLRARRTEDRPVRVGHAITAALLRGEGGPGLLSGCHQGFLVVETEDLVAEEGTWAALRESIARGRIRRGAPDREEGEEATPPFPVDSDPAAVSLILVGPEATFKKLAEADRRVTSLFPRRIVMQMDLPRTRQGAGWVVGRLRRTLAQEGLGEANSGALAWLVEEASRLAPRRQRLAVDLRELEALLEEGRDEQPEAPLQKSSLQAAARARRLRLGAPEQRHRRRVRLRQLLLETEGGLQGVVNGLMVYGMGLAAYAMPGRITARAFLGREGLINVEREAKYSGRSYDKGIFLLNGFLRGKFARHAPLGVGITLAFEQSYGKVDGDSATLAEAIALISELSGLPCRQDLAVTGAINQRGEVLPVGSLNRKIEGWWASCKDRGITKTQGVLFPRTSAKDLQLSEEVVAVVEEGSFHLWAVNSIDQALEVALGMDAGIPDERGHYPEDSVYGRAWAELLRMSTRLHPPRTKTGADSGTASGTKTAEKTTASKKTASKKTKDKKTEGKKTEGKKTAAKKTAGKKTAGEEAKQSAGANKGPRKKPTAKPAAAAKS